MSKVALGCSLFIRTIILIHLFLINRIDKKKPTPFGVGLMFPNLYLIASSYPVVSTVMPASSRCSVNNFTCFRNLVVNSVSS